MEGLGFRAWVLGFTEGLGYSLGSPRSPEPKAITFEGLLRAHATRVQGVQLTFLP